ncbi:hypothetical protein F2P81_015135 [Scophthalmus maximus]|uniref:Uncharacterized protein n=1 Tax=Scophthalmus maximus TaxID=52904 RepID=A0A6A4SJY9_SCOMX|nr:hypothetical protein F2P81_015135 [Scophthalmus maximus]
MSCETEPGRVRDNVKSRCGLISLRLRLSDRPHLKSQCGHKVTRGPDTLIRSLLIFSQMTDRYGGFCCDSIEPKRERRRRRQQQGRASVT